MEISPLAKNTQNIKSSFLNDSNSARPTPSQEREMIEQQQQSQLDLNHIRDAYEKQSETESARNDDALETQRNRGYERLRDLKRAQQAELSQIRKRGEDEIAQLKDYYQHNTTQIETKGEQDLREYQDHEVRNSEYQKKVNEEQAHEIKQEYDQKTNQLIKNSDERLSTLNEANQKRFEQNKTSTETAYSEAERSANEKFQNLTRHYDQVFNGIETHAGDQIQKIRRDTADKLSAYETRQADPFYKMMDIHAKLEDNEDAYVLTATIPRHEQGHITATLKGDNLVISGTRQNQENQVISPGHTVGSESFQTFHESFPLSWPVDAHRLTREFDEDQVIIRVPKKATYVIKASTPKTPDKIRVVPPYFPENLPGSHLSHPGGEVGNSEDEPPTPRVALPKPGSGTLT